MSYTFGTATLRNVSPSAPTYNIRATEHTLLNGKSIIQSVTNYGTRWRLQCFTTDYADITALLALIGTSQSLTLEEVNTTCYLMALSVTETTPTSWKYVVEFAKDES